MTRVTLPYPFDNPKTQYYYFARNAIYALALLWNLSGQEVLFPTYFEGIELDALLSAGIEPRFYRVRDRMRVNPEDVVSQIGPKTRAVYLIHYLGFPGPIEEIADVCRARDVLLIEDCALALLSRREERPLGSLGDAAIFSIHKTLPVPNGGALVLGRGQISQLTRRTSPALSSTLAYVVSSLRLYFELRGDTWAKLISKGMKSLAKAGANVIGAEPVPLGAYHFDRSQADLGMSRLCHVVIPAQKFSLIVERRRSNYLQLLDRLGHISPPIFDRLPPGVCPLFYPMETENSQVALERLLARGVGAVSFWSRDHPFVPRGMHPEADRLRRTVLQLPCHQDLTPPIIDRIADQVSEVLRDLK
jgi:dTDP-4-amino-4,6-dideoxygalactose transaminase